MAKKGNRLAVGLECTVCKATNYVTQRNKMNTTEALKMKKFCKQCNSRVEHKEKKKLH